MNRSLVVWVSLAIILLGGRGAAQYPPKDEPAFQGKPLSYWVAQLKDRDALVRDEAVEVLAQLGPAARAAVPEVAMLLKDENATVRRKAALALWKIDGQTGPAVAALGEALRDPNRNVRQQAIYQLQHIGPVARDAAPALVEMLSDPNSTESQ